MSAPQTLAEYAKKHKPDVQCFCISRNAKADDTRGEGPHGATCTTCVSLRSEPDVPKTAPVRRPCQSWSKACVYWTPRR